MDSRDLNAYRSLKQELIERARKVAENAASYRGFKVGCALLARRPKGETTLGHYKIITAANVKPLRDGPKACAEQTALAYAHSNGFEHAVVIVIAGEPQADEKSGLETSTLHPCWQCRVLMKTLPLVTDETLIITIRNHAGEMEEHTFKELLQLHER